MIFLPCIEGEEEFDLVETSSEKEEDSLNGFIVNDIEDNGSEEDDNQEEEDSLNVLS